METEFYIERQILFWRLLIPIPEIPIDKLTAEMLSCCVEQPLWATARLAVFSLPDSISFRHFVYFYFGDWYKKLSAIYADRFFFYDSLFVLI